MKKFEVGKAYSMRSPGDYNCIWSYIVKARTAQTITLQAGNEIKKCRVIKELSEVRGAESLLPLGKYSLAPILSAEKEVVCL